ncbi:unnamed protein product [Caenorhabditis auriculariae]|uniref:Hemimethylated DNA-binding domain-containing protein n=1 Tax=Caenorhabditis auriculariae TaxID=2777116 RepID=A0A8S1GMU3_9PELO|nr:unnamed protein product [Caenorhabditis auriculariae]
MEIPPYAVFVLLLAIVPAQYYLSPRSTSDIKYHLHSAIDSLKSFWRQYRARMLKIDYVEPEEDINAVPLETETDVATTPFYGLGRYLRDRAPHVEFRVGEIVKHHMGFRGVVVGWDVKARAPQDFITKVHKGNKEWSNSPNYAVLIDVRDRPTPQIAYLVQGNLIRDKGRIFHPLLKNYLEHYDDNKQKYLAKPWLRDFFPDD